MGWYIPRGDPEETCSDKDKARLIKSGAGTSISVPFAERNPRCGVWDPPPRDPKGFVLAVLGGRGGET